jgi:hypothetical protein
MLEVGSSSSGRSSTCSVKRVVYEFQRNNGEQR